ncbi:hypothetical protein D3C86_1654060 [compost metagenome]
MAAGRARMSSSQRWRLGRGAWGTGVPIQRCAAQASAMSAMVKRSPPMNSRLASALSSIAASGSVRSHDLAIIASSRFSAGTRTICRKAETMAGLNAVVCQSIQRSAEARSLTSDGHSVPSP